MYDCQKPHRDPYGQILDYRGSALSREVLTPWLKAHPAEAAQVGELAAYDPDDWAALEDQSACWMYSLSRISQVLVLGRQRPIAETYAPDITVDEYVAFFSQLGMQPLEPSAFDPFLHEIHGISDDAGASAFAIADELSPTLKVGQALFARGLVNLRGRNSSAEELDPAMAQASKIYWAFRRRNRPCEDESHGWGSNSQWRTPFRIDLDLGDSRVYNLHGEADIEGDIEEDSLSFAQRREILTYRHAVTSTTDEIVREEQPFLPHYRYTAARSDGLLE